MHIYYVWSRSVIYSYTHRHIMDTMKKRQSRESKNLETTLGSLLKSFSFGESLSPIPISDHYTRKSLKFGGLATVSTHVYFCDQCGCFFTNLDSFRAHPVACFGFPSTHALYTENDYDQQGTSLMIHLLPETIFQLPVWWLSFLLYCGVPCKRNTYAKHDMIVLTTREHNAGHSRICGLVSVPSTMEPAEALPVSCIWIAPTSRGKGYFSSKILSVAYALYRQRFAFLPTAPAPAFPEFPWTDEGEACINNFIVRSVLVYMSIQCTDTTIAMLESVLLVPASHMQQQPAAYPPREHGLVPLLRDAAQTAGMAFQCGCAVPKYVCVQCRLRVPWEPAREWPGNTIESIARDKSRWFANGALNFGAITDIAHMVRTAQPHAPPFMLTS